MAGMNRLSALQVTTKFREWWISTKQHHDGYFSPIRSNLSRVIWKPSENERSLVGFFAKCFCFGNYSSKGPSPYTRELYALADNLLENNIKGKRVLVVPGYSTNPFVFRLLGAKEVCGVDIDETTTFWAKAFVNYFYHNNIGDRYMKMAYYPEEPSEGISDRDLFSDLTKAVLSLKKPKPIKNIKFKTAALGSAPKGVKNIKEVLRGEEEFDYFYIPWLLGVVNGIEIEEEIIKAYEDIWELANQGAIVMITPFAGSEDNLIEQGMTNDKMKRLKKLMPQDKFQFLREDIAPGSGATYVFLRVVK